MTRPLTAVLLAAAIVGFALPAAAAYLPNGSATPNFTKPQHLTGVPRSFSEFAGKVVVLFQYGWNCPECLNDGPAFEQEIHQYYQGTKPNEVAVLGVDMFNGTDPQVTAFKNSTAATYLLLRNGGLAAGIDLDDLATGLGPNDNYLVINKQGVIRFNSIHEYPHGDRYHPSRIRACVDSLVAQNVGVEPPSAIAIGLAARPNPFAGAATIELVVPGDRTAAHVTVHDVTGRHLATLWHGPAPAGTTRLTWDGQDADGRPAPTGVYLVRANVGSTTRSLRLVRLR